MEMRQRNGSTAPRLVMVDTASATSFCDCRGADHGLLERLPLPRLLSLPTIDTIHMRIRGELFNFLSVGSQ
jgi:hypothetical protein